MLSQGGLPMQQLQMELGSRKEHLQDHEFILEFGFLDPHIDARELRSFS